MRSIELVINRLTDAIIEGKAAAPPEPAPAADNGQGRGDRGGRRGSGRGEGLRGAVRQRDTEPKVAATRVRQSDAAPAPEPEASAVTRRSRRA